MRDSVVRDLVGGAFDAFVRETRPEWRRAARSVATAYGVQRDTDDLEQEMLIACWRWSRRVLADVLNPAAHLHYAARGAAIRAARSVPSVGVDGGGDLVASQERADDVFAVRRAIEEVGNKYGPLYAEALNALAAGDVDRLWEHEPTRRRLRVQSRAHARAAARLSAAIVKREVLSG